MRQERITLSGFVRQEHFRGKEITIQDHSLCQECAFRDCILVGNDMAALLLRCVVDHCDLRRCGVWFSDCTVNSIPTLGLRGKGE